ncbi:MAG: DUF1579 domain-containing protein [Planctomycetota bacterium]
MACGLSLHAHAGDGESTVPPDSADFQKAWEAYGAPGPAHEEMTKRVGDWAVEASSWVPGNDEPVVSAATADIEMILGGRFLRQKYVGSFDGTPYAGEGTLAYDNKLKVYKGTWIDTVSTGIMLTEGTYDAESKTLTETGKSIGPFPGANTKFITHYISDDHFVMTVYCDETGQMRKSMQLIYTRVTE